MVWVEKSNIAKKILTEAATLALQHFHNISSLQVDQKGHQDFVSQADRTVEVFVREKLSFYFPDDGIVGEEGKSKPSKSGFTWVIDPIDGTANFINGIPTWAVVLAGVYEDKVVIGVIYDVCQKEMFSAIYQNGAFLNGERLPFLSKGTLKKGSVGFGLSNRSCNKWTINVLAQILDAGGVFQRNGSGALSLAYVASGRLLGYVEQYMKAWDCLAGQLLVAEAGGITQLQSVEEMIEDGGEVIVGAPDIFEKLLEISQKAWVEL
jgi:myo-inositol-1(or 4)-monophosphatase